MNFMKFIKLYENFQEISFNLSHKDKYVISYEFKIEDDIYDVHFKICENNYYQREYNLRRNRDFDLVNKNPYLIVKTVSNITKKFIEDYSPDIIEIPHISDKNSKKNEMNLRAKLNYRFLKTIKDYKFDYFFWTSGKYSTVFLLLSKNDIDIYDEKYPLNINIKSSTKINLL